MRERVEAGDTVGATTLALQVLGPEVMGFLAHVSGSVADAEEVFAAASERLWRSFGSFGWRCSLRTWMYRIAHGELARFRAGARRVGERRLALSEVSEAALAVSRNSREASIAARETLVARLRDELSEGDRMLLVLRVDRSLSWEDIAVVFLEGDSGDAEALRREAARLRKRFQLVKERLSERARLQGGPSA